MSALTSRALKKISTSSKGATSVLETLVRIIWICESKREGLLTSQSKVMVQNVSERSFFTFHYHFEGNFDVGKNWAIIRFWCNTFFSRCTKKLSTHPIIMMWVFQMFFKCSSLHSKKIRVIESLDKKISTRIKKRVFNPQTTGVKSLDAENWKNQHFHRQGLGGGRHFL